MNSNVGIAVVKKKKKKQKQDYFIQQSILLILPCIHSYITVHFLEMLYYLQTNCSAVL